MFICGHGDFYQYALHSAIFPSGARATVLRVLLWNKLASSDMTREVQVLFIH